MLKIQSTENIPLEIVKNIESELSQVLDVKAQEQQFFHKAADPPTWITFIAETEWWQKALVAGTAIYITTLIQEAAKSTWKMISKTISRKNSRQNPIIVLADNISSSQKHLPPRTQIFLSIPIPDEYNSSALELTLGSSEEIAMQVALFAHHLPELMHLIRNEISPDDRILGSFQLTLLDDGALKIVWKTMSFDLQTRILKLQESA